MYFFSVYSAFVLLKQQYNELSLRNEENNYATTWLGPASCYFKHCITLLFFNCSVLYPRRGCYFGGLIYVKLEQRDAGLLITEGLALWAILREPWLSTWAPCQEAYCQCQHTTCSRRWESFGQRGWAAWGRLVMVLQHSSGAQASLRACREPPESLWCRAVTIGFLPAGYHGATRRVTSAFRAKSALAHCGSCCFIPHPHLQGRWEFL